MNSNGSVQWASISSYWKEDSNSFSKTNRNMNEAKKKSLAILVGIIAGNLGIDVYEEGEVFSKKISDKVDKQVDKMVAILKNGQSPDYILDVSESVWSKGNNRCYKIRFYSNQDNLLWYISIQAHK